MKSTPSEAACRRCESPLEPEDLRCAVCALPVPFDPAARISEEVAQILRCNGCGAAISYSAEARAPRCDFCGSVMEVETPEDPVEQAEQFLRFCVSDEQARGALSSWLGGLGFFRPSDLQARAAVDALKPLWWAGWIFEAEGTMYWAADSDAGSRRSRWAPHSGQCSLSVRNVVVPASRGLTEDECSALIPHYNVSNAVPQPEGHPKATVEQFAVQRSAARQLIRRALEAVAVARATQQAPGSSHRNVHVSVLPTRLSSGHYAFPAYVLAYRYKDKLYRAIIHGQNARCVVGEAPWSWARIGIVVGIVAAVVVIILAIMAMS